MLFIKDKLKFLVESIKTIHIEDMVNSYLAVLEGDDKKINGQFLMLVLKTNL